MFFRQIRKLIWVHKNIEIPPILLPRGNHYLPLDLFLSTFIFMYLCIRVYFKIINSFIHTIWQLAFPTQRHVIYRIRTISLSLIWVIAEQTLESQTIMSLTGLLFRLFWSFLSSSLLYKVMVGNSYQEKVREIKVSRCWKKMARNFQNPCILVS